MKIYFSHSSKYDYTNDLYLPIKKSDLIKENSFFFPEEHRDVKSKDIITNSDLVIAEVSLPGTGQGIEIGWADFAETPILCVYKKGANISSSLRFITDKYIEYEDTADMIKKIGDFISKMQV